MEKECNKGNSECLIQLRKLMELCRAAEFQCCFTGLVSVWCAKGGNQKISKWLSWT